MASGLTRLGSGASRRPSATGPITTSKSPIQPRSWPRRQVRLPSRATLRRRGWQHRARDRSLQGRAAAPHRQRGPPSRARNLRRAPLRRETTARPPPAARKGQKAVQLSSTNVTTSTPLCRYRHRGTPRKREFALPDPGTARISGPSADGPVGTPPRNPASERPPPPSPPPHADYIPPPYTATHMRLPSVSFLRALESRQVTAIPSVLPSYWDMVALHDSFLSQASSHTGHTKTWVHETCLHLAVSYAASPFHSLSSVLAGVRRPSSQAAEGPTHRLGRAMPCGQ